MLSVTDWLIKKIVAKVIKRAFRDRFGYDLNLNFTVLETEYDDEDDSVVLSFSGKASMDMHNFEKMVEKMT